MTDENGNTAWLFGSIHVGRDDFYPLPDYVYEAYNQADAAAFEFDIVSFEADYAAQAAALQILMYTDGTTIKDHLPEETYNQAVALMTDAGYYMSMLDYYTVPMWSTLLDQLLYEDLGIDLMSGIDRHLLNKAHEEDKPVYGVESAELQYRMMADFSPALQEMLLEASIESWSEPELVKEGLDYLLECWASGSEADIIDAIAAESEGMTEEELVLYAEYNKALCTDRNLGMADYVENALRSGEKVFICVGEAHVVGEGALVDLLTQRGYTVTCLGGNPIA